MVIRGKTLKSKMISDEEKNSHRHYDHTVLIHRRSHGCTCNGRQRANVGLIFHFFVFYILWSFFTRKTGPTIYWYKKSLSDKFFKKTKIHLWSKLHHKGQQHSLIRNDYLINFWMCNLLFLFLITIQKHKGRRKSYS